MSQGSVEVRVWGVQQWHLVHRLLADTEVDGKDLEEYTVLHLVLKTKIDGLINIAVLSGSSLLEKNRKRVTAYQAAQKRSGRQRCSSSVADYLTAVGDGGLVKVKTHLCQDVSVQDMDSEGDTGLLAACRVGLSVIADLLIWLNADIHVVDLHGYTGHYTGHLTDLQCTIPGPA